MTGDITEHLHLGGIDIDVVFKDIKNIHLGVYPPDGRVRIAAPTRSSLEALRAFAVSRLPWIKHQRRKFHEQERETPREYLDRESHYLWGRRYLLEIDEQDAAPAVTLQYRTLVLRIRPGSSEETREAAMTAWYRQQVRTAAARLVREWEPTLGVAVNRVFVQRMKTRWGSCNPTTGAIRLNTELAKKPEECLEYIVVHELMHLLERNHTDRFTRLMDQHLPRWRERRALLNSAPLGSEAWRY